MLLFIASQYQRRLASLCLISLLFGMAPSPGWCRQGVTGENRNVVKVNRFFPSVLQNNSTKEILLLLAKRRLQVKDNPIITDVEIGSNETDVRTDIPTPTNGCTICHGTTFMPDNVPNQNWLPELAGSTCRDWQDYILTEIYPTGENCKNDFMYQDLFVPCCKLPIPRYQCEQNVHDLISSRKDYNIAVPPIVSHDEPLVVMTDVIYEYAEEINVMSGTATILVTVTLKWKDPRLAWAIDETTCANFIEIWTGYGNEETFIWVPDFDLLNQKEGLQGFPATLATVSSDGTVSWTLSGSLTAMCQYHGLASIPYDTLGCQFLFGARSRLNSNMVYYQLESYGTMKIGTSNIQYSEYLPVPELFEKGYTWYFNTDYSQALYYNFYFRRATDYYVFNIVTPTIIFTYCSFCTFLLDMRVGERLGFGLALALVVVAAQIVTTDMIPISNRKLWIDKFVAWSFYWVLVVLVQSVFVAFVFYLREDYEAAKEGRRLSTMSAGSQDCMMESAAMAMVPPPLPKDAHRKTTNNTRNNQSPAKPERKPWFLYSTRKFDYICLAFCIVSYTVFIICMFSSNFSGAWVKDEAPWDSYDTQYGSINSENNVPDDPYMQEITL